jgi:hypothetical protein
MNLVQMKKRIKNIDRRLGRIEQILPTLTTKAELQAAIEPRATRAELQAAIEPLATKVELQAAVEPLATKVELQAAIEPLATKVELQAAIEPLATKVELQAAIEPLATKVELREEGDRTRRHMDIIAESLRDDIRLLAEGHGWVSGRLADHDARITRLEQDRNDR